MRINLLKKVVVGGLITSLCLCCCFLNFNKNVKASVVNEQTQNIVVNSDFTSMFNFKNYEHIEELNDLKGTMWVCNYDSSYPTFSDDFNTYTINYISPYDAVQENNYLLAPFILQGANYFIFSSGLSNDIYTKCYSLSNNKSLEFVENFANHDILKNFLSINATTAIWTPESSKFTFSNDSYVLDEVIISSNVEMLNINGFGTSQLDILYSYIMKQNNPDYAYWSSLVGSGMSSPIFLFFPNSDYTLEFSSSNELVDESVFIEYFKKQFTLIEIENFSIWKNEILEDIAFDKGYNDGYLMGYNQGVYDVSDTNYRFPFLTGIFNAVSDILALEIFPNVRLGYFVLIPLALGVTGMIFWFWRKD